MIILYYYRKNLVTFNENPDAHNWLRSRSAYITAGHWSCIHTLFTCNIRDDRRCPHAGYVRCAVGSRAHECWALEQRCNNALKLCNLAVYHVYDEEMHVVRPCDTLHSQPQWLVDERAALRVLLFMSKSYICAKGTVGDDQVAAGRKPSSRIAAYRLAAWSCVI